jgi:raffinose/stachyose/melibiose transport system substrate-binding protein
MRLQQSRTLIRLGALGVVGALALSACSADGGGSDDVVQITAWGNHPEWKDTLDEITEIFNDSHPGIEVNWEYKPNANYQAAVNTAVSGGQAPDIFGWLEGTSIRTGASDGIIADLTGVVDPEQLIDAARAQVEFDGKVWGSALSAYTVGIYYQRDIFEEQGLEVPTTWDELIDVSKALDDAGITAWAMPSKDMILPYFFYTLAIGGVLGEDGYQDLLAGDRELTEPELVEAAQLLLDLQPYFNEGFEAQGYAEGKAAFAEGRAAMIIGGSADFAGYQQTNPDVNVGVFGFPAPDGGASVTTSGLDLNYTVWAESPHPEEAGEFIAWLSSEEAQQVVADKLSIPIRPGISPSGDNEVARIAREMIEAGQPNLPLLLDTPQGGNTLGAVAENSGIFSGSVTAEQFAAAVQAAMILK